MPDINKITGNITYIRDFIKKSIQDDSGNKTYTLGLLEEVEKYITDLQYSLDHSNNRRN